MIHTIWTIRYESYIVILRSIWQIQRRMLNSLNSFQRVVYVMFDLISDPFAEVCASWTSWINSTPCNPNPSTGSGFRNRRRCCDDSETCRSGELDAIECTPRECINIECDCNVQSDTFGFRNGVCSSKVPFKVFLRNHWIWNSEFHIWFQVVITWEN